VVATITSRGGDPDSWFELTVDGPGSDSIERVRVTITSNLQESDYAEHRVVIEDERVLNAALQGDTVSVCAVSRLSCVNIVASAGIEMYVAY